MIGQRRALQIAVLLGSIVPIGAGLTGVLSGGRFLAEHAAMPALQDSHFRYLSGLLLAIGLAFAISVPGIERRTDRFRLLSALVLIGGVARLGGVILTGPPSGSVIFALVMELAVTPSLALWQSFVARDCAETHATAASDFTR
jgi:hypothetical protein